MIVFATMSGMLSGSFQPQPSTAIATFKTNKEFFNYITKNPKFAEYKFYFKLAIQFDQSICKK